MGASIGAMEGRRIELMLKSYETRGTKDGKGRRKALQCTPVATSPITGTSQVTLNSVCNAGHINAGNLPVMSRILHCELNDTIYYTKRLVLMRCQ